MIYHDYYLKICPLNSVNLRANPDLSSLTALFQASSIHIVNQWQEDKTTAALVVVDDETSEQEEEACIRELRQDERHILALYLGEKPLPFFRIWRLLNMGVADVLEYRSGMPLAEVVLGRFVRWDKIDRILYSGTVNNLLVGRTPEWRRCLRQVIEIACFSSASVLILGESGTGKELVARLIHELDPRPDKQNLTLVDCTTISPELSGSELFGHEKGAFTHALANRDGAMALADRGTLFLDEIGELPLRIQAELLRASQEGMYKRVGSNIWRNAQFRLICATNRNLEQEVAQGHFRQDLFYRLSACVVHLPPLRERRLDIPELARHFLGQALQNKSVPMLDPMVERYLMLQDYPGNIRQLRQLMYRIAYRYTGRGIITMGDIPESDRLQAYYCPHHWQQNGFKDAIRQALAEGVGLKDIKRIAGDVAMELAVESTEGNVQEAARRLDVSDRLIQGYLAERKRE